MTTWQTPQQAPSAGALDVSGCRRVADAGMLAHAVPGQVARLVGLAPQGLRAAYRPSDGGFAQTVRATRGQRIAPEGANLRYAAIAALGLHQLPSEQQRAVLDGRTAADVVDDAMRRATTATDPGAVAITAWAAAEVGGWFAEDLFTRVLGMLASRTALPAVDVSWMLTAAIAAAPYGDTTEIVGDTTTRLLQRQGPGGLFPHLLAPRRETGWRRHVGSFADQVYPLQALARAGAAGGDGDLVAAANLTAARICELQGPAGQWWWWYDARTGDVVERYPVYSVHQHAMAPMVLMDLVEAGGDDHRAEVVAGLGWLDAHPEAPGTLIEDELGVVWRKVGRREPRKAARALAAATTAIRPGWRLPGLDRLLPPRVIDHECRPYELGWLLYAWLSHDHSWGGPRLRVVPDTAQEADDD